MNYNILRFVNGCDYNLSNFLEEKKKGFKWTQGIIILIYLLYRKQERSQYCFDLSLTSILMTFSLNISRFYCSKSIVTFLLSAGIGIKGWVKSKQPKGLSYLRNWSSELMSNQIPPNFIGVYGVLPLLVKIFCYLLK